MEVGQKVLIKLRSEVGLHLNSNWRMLFLYSSNLQKVSVRKVSIYWPRRIYDLELPRYRNNHRLGH